MNTKKVIFGLMACLMLFSVTATAFTIGDDEPSIEKKTTKPKPKR